MGGHQYTALITGKLVVEPRPALPVQVVSGFVQQQIIRLRRKRPAQQRADTLATAEFSGWLIRIKRRQCRPGKRLAQAFC
jgi:hypothetical protein